METSTENGFNISSMKQTIPKKVFPLSNDFVPEASGLLNEPAYVQRLGNIISSNVSFIVHFICFS